MPACLSRSLGFASLSVASSLKKQQHDQNCRPVTISSLRRSLSADDMASQKWETQTGLKKVGSLENLQIHDDDDNGGQGFGSGSGSGSEAFEEIWSSIQGKKEVEEEETERPRNQTDIWSLILTQKKINEQDGNNTGENLPPPYIHPLVKRSASSLSEKSLEICTESLGSETGSDCFSPEPGCDSEPEECKEAETEAPSLPQVEKVVVMGSSPASCYSVSSVKQKSSAAPGVAAPVRSFPPPLPSLGHRGDGSNVQMRSHRQNGRLVLQAVSVPSNNCFKAERQDGRLLLRFSGEHVSDSERADVEKEGNGSAEDDGKEEADEVMVEQGKIIEDDEGEEGQETDSEEEEEEEYVDVVMGDDELACGEGGMVGYVAGAHKFLGLTRNVASWPRRLNSVVNTLEDDEDDNRQSTLSAATTLGVRAHGPNPYVYSWRSKGGPGPTVVTAQLKDPVVEVVVEGKSAGKVEEDLVPLFLRGCNPQQPKRSLLLWEPHCIATS